MDKIAKEIRIPEQKEFDGKVFPLVLAPVDPEVSKADTLKFVDDFKEELQDLMIKYGAILFRGFPLGEAKDFDDFAGAFLLEDIPYIGGAAPRNLVVGNVYTTNESPPENIIPFHHEMAQVPVYPYRVFFYCEIPAKVGGETPILMSSVVHDRMLAIRPDFVKKLEEHGVIYTRVIGADSNNGSAIGRGWKATYCAEDPKEAERIAKTCMVNFEWLHDGFVRTVSDPIPAVRYYDRAGKKQWFNSIVAAYLGWKDAMNDPTTAVKFGNGDPMDADAIYDCDKIMQEIRVAYPWQYKDCIMIDNRQVMHARNTFERPRRVLAYLTKTG